MKRFIKEYWELILLVLILEAINFIDVSIPVKIAIILSVLICWMALIFCTFKRELEKKYPISTSKKKKNTRNPKLKKEQGIEYTL